MSAITGQEVAVYVSNNWSRGSCNVSKLVKRLLYMSAITGQKVPVMSANWSTGGCICRQ